MIRHKDIEWDGDNPALMYGYGSYEASMDPGFGPARLSLLDRGVIFVVAHVRGGGELGRQWYENGKKLAKKILSLILLTPPGSWPPQAGSTPIKSLRWVVSAGGLLMGGVLNLAPNSTASVSHRCHSWMR